jgi:polyphosphate kinase
VVGLETHAKVLLVVREEQDRLRRYVHIGTGDYHPQTASSYSDLGLLTCDETIAQDIGELFNYLTTGFTPWRKYRAVMPAPKLLKKALLTRIRREAELSRQGRGGLIRFKMNALDDSEIIRALYRASQAGVRIELYVRDSCRLRPGVPGLSDNISVVSTVGRFFEHARIYHFGNGGLDDYFISSADAIKGNLESRVEILCPVSTHSATKELAAIFDLHRADRRSSWDMQPDGSYQQRRPLRGEPEEGLQEMTITRIQETFSELVATVGKMKILGLHQR